jgi:hypothetical protein
MSAEVKRQRSQILKQRFREKDDVLEKKTTPANFKATF